MATMAKDSALVTLPADNQIQIRRDFEAPKRLVFKAYTTPELVERWWHAGHGVMKSCEIDLRVGGRWRYAMDANNGFEVAFHGEYREILPNERLVTTEVYEGAPNAPALTTATFEEQDGRTRLTILSEYDSRATRDAVLQSGMESGMQVALNLLEQVAAELDC